jgi:hypothetical protein
MIRQFATWTRWIGWTAVFAVALSVWGAAVFPASSLRVPDAVVQIVFWGGILGLAALAFAIGVRVADWSWVLGVVVASWLQGYIVATVLESPYRTGGPTAPELMPLFVVYLLFTLPAAWGVRLGQQRKADLSANPTSGDRWTPASAAAEPASAASPSRGGFSGVRGEVERVVDSEEIRPVVDSNESKVPFGSFVVLTLDATLLVVLFLIYAVIRMHLGPSFCNGPECAATRVYLDVSMISSFVAFGCLLRAHSRNRLLGAALGASIVAVVAGVATGFGIFPIINIFMLVFGSLGLHDVGGRER